MTFGDPGLMHDEHIKTNAKNVCIGTIYSDATKYIITKIYA